MQVAARKQFIAIFRIHAYNAAFPGPFLWRGVSGFIRFIPTAIIKKNGSD
jgi:hypothetical protein